MKHPPRIMTVEHLNWLLMVIDTDMPQQAKWIAAYLNTYMNSTQHKAWPSMGRMVKDLSLSKNTVQKHMGILIAEGWLSKKPGGVFNGKNTPNTYMLEWPERIKNSQKSEQKESPTSDLPESIDCQEGGQEVTYGGQEATYGGQEVAYGGSGGDPKSVIESEIESEKNKTLCSSGDEQEYASFDAFWDQWPKNVDKKNARAVWNKLKPDQQLFDKIMLNLQARRQNGDFEKSVLQYVPGPAKYLRNQLWEDVVIPRTQPGSSPAEDASKWSPAMVNIARLQAEKMAKAEAAKARRKQQRGF